MKTKPHPKSHQHTDKARALPPAERRPLKPADALLLEKLNAVRAARLMEQGIIAIQIHARDAVVRANDAVAAIGKRAIELSDAKTIASRELAEVMMSRPNEPVQFDGMLHVYMQGVGLRTFTASPLVLGVQS